MSNQPAGLTPLADVLRNAVAHTTIKDVPKLLLQAANRIEDLEAEVARLKSSAQSSHSNIGG